MKIISIVEINMSGDLESLHTYSEKQREKAEKKFLSICRENGADEIEYTDKELLLSKEYEDDSGYQVSMEITKLIE